MKGDCWALEKVCTLLSAILVFTVVFIHLLDTIDHGILSDPLESQFGISDRALAWLKSYLSVRTLRISYDDITSIFTDGKYGTPQGSVLDPLLFSLCI